MHVFSCKVVLYGVTVQSHQSAPRNTVLGSCARAAQQQIAPAPIGCHGLRGTKDTRSTLEVWLRWSCLWIFRVVHRATGYCNITHVGFLLKMLYCILSILSSIYHNSAGAQLVDWGVQLKSPPGYGIAMVAFSDGFWRLLWNSYLRCWSKRLNLMSYVAPLLSEHVPRLLNGGHDFLGGEIPRSKLMQFFAVCWGSIRHPLTAWYVLTTAHWYCEASRVCKRCCSCHLFEEHMYRFQWCIYI